MVWKEWAWHGIRFLAPSNWDAGKLGPGYMMLEEESGPVMEVRSGPIKGTFSPGDQLKRLGASQDRQLRKGIREIKLPTTWQESLKSFRVLGFSWRGESVRGRGLIVYCPACGKATVLQFFEGQQRRVDSRTSLAILESFQDHRRDDQVLWAVFDIRARVPGAYKLTRHRFDAGAFEMVFSKRGQKITLYRWGPASVLMPKGDLLSLVERLPDLHKKDLRHIIFEGMRGLEWKEEPSRTAPGRLWQRVNVKPSMKRFRLWHMEGKNRILGVGFEGRGKTEEPLFDRICKNYECV